jgi:ferredoxin-NADP reductase
MVTRLGARRWTRLHRLVYAVGILAALHYYLLVKSDVRQPLVFAGVLATLLALRLVRGRTVTPPVSPQRFWSGELRVADVVQETPDVKTFRLVPAAGGKLPFVHQPGQYLNLALSIDGKRVNRSYTIASSPTRDASCEVTVKRSATGHASRFMHDQVRAGSTLKVSAPAGKFIFTGAQARRVVLIAGGVGVTPLMAIVRYLTDRAWRGDIYFLFSVRRRADLVFAKEWTDLQRRFPNLHVCPTLSRPDPQDDWTGERGQISKDLLTRFVPGLTESPIFLCGPDAMMASVTTMLRDLGVPEVNIHTEAFVSPAGEGSREVPASSVVTGGRIRFARSTVSTEASPAVTVLEVAEASGVDIPFECRSGICGQCKTRLLAGQVAMDSDDALTPSDRAQGLILACQARPAGDIVVDA